MFQRTHNASAMEIKALMLKDRGGEIAEGASLDGVDDEVGRIDRHLVKHMGANAGQLVSQASLLLRLAGRHGEGKGLMAKPEPHGKNGQRP